MGAEVNITFVLTCDYCEQEGSSRDLFKDQLVGIDDDTFFDWAREVDWWYFYSTGVAVCNDCLHFGPWLGAVNREQLKSGNISDDQLVEVIDSYPDPDDKDFPYHFWVPEVLDLSDEMIERIASRLKGSVTLVLNGLTSLSDAAAKSLGKHEGELRLNGLTELSDAAAESLSKCEGELDLNGLTSLSDTAAESLSKHEGGLELHGLTELSDAAAESLSKHEGSLYLNGLTELSDAAAENLSKHEGRIKLDGLTELSDAAAKSLGKHEGTLSLEGLTKLSDAAAESLSKHEGDLWLDLDELPESAAKILRDAGHG